MFDFAPERPSRISAEDAWAQGPIRRRVAGRPRADAAGSGPAVLAKTMEPIALTKPSPTPAAPCTAVGAAV